MRRFAALSIVLIALAFSVTGCGGGGNNSANIPSSISFSITTYSLNYGQIVQLSPTVKNYAGNTISGQTVVFSSSNPTVADVANGSSYPGIICAGSWNSEVNPVDCHAASKTGTATITAMVSGTSINTTVTVYVHPAIGSIAVGAVSTTATSTSLTQAAPTCTDNTKSSTCTCADSTWTLKCPSTTAFGCSCVQTTTTANAPATNGVDLTNCLSAANSTLDTASFKATVCTGTGAVPGSCPNGTDITTAVGPLTWTITPGSIGILDTTGKTCTNTDGSGLCTITSTLPGQAVVTARVGNVTSSPAAKPGSALLTTCPITNISLIDSNGKKSSSNASGATVTLAATATDSKYNVYSSLPSTMKYSTSQPVVAAAGASISNATAGAATLLVSCLPPNCNPGFYPVYSNPYVLNTTGTDTTVAYAANSKFTNVASNANPLYGAYLVPITTSATATTSAITISTDASHTPNSMLITATGANIVLGSDTGGVLIYNISGATTTSTSFNGAVVAASPDGNTIVVYDVNATPTAYVYSIASSSIVGVIPMAGTTAARVSFSPDSGTAYILGISNSSNILYTWNSSAAPLLLGLPTTSTPFSDVGFLTEGSFAYLAGGSSNITAYASCNNAPLSSPPASLSLTTQPQVLRSLPNGAGLLAFASTDVTLLPLTDSSYSPVIKASGTNCQPDETYGAASTASLPHAVDWSKSQLILSSDSSKAFILDPSQTSVIVYDITKNNFSTIPIINGTAGATPTTGAMLPDSTYLWFGASDDKFHRITVTTNSTTGAITYADDEQIAMPSTPANFHPTLVSVVP